MALKILNHPNTQDVSDSDRRLRGGLYHDGNVDYDALERNAITLLIQNDIDTRLSLDSASSKEAIRAQALGLLTGILSL
jgi:hypothetical protein